MSLPLLLLFAATEFVLSLSPGPAVLLVVSQGMRFGARASVLGTLGVITGNALYFAVSALGLGAVLMTSEVLFYSIKWAGAAYLIYLGVGLIRDTLGARTLGATTEFAASHSRLFRQCLLTQLGNPKAILFFTALLPQFIDSQGSLWVQCLLLATTSIAIELPILVGYGWLAHVGGHFIRQGRYGRWLDRLAGTFLIAAGIKLALVRRA
jgi:homoserine/homoserine lactone efflux protein